VRPDEPERRFAAGQVLRAEGSARRFTVEHARDHSGRLLVRFRELADRTAAEQARGTVLVADVDARERPDDPEEFYDHQLVGLRVLDQRGATVGMVTGVVHVPQQDMLEIDTGDQVRLVPFVSALVPEVDLVGGCVHVADVSGLLSDADDE
jgi:16S rRNA processing protein RimM